MPPLINVGILYVQSRHLAFGAADGVTTYLFFSYSIAHVYHGKIVQDKTDDKRLRGREPVPNFLYNFLIRQYGRSCFRSLLYYCPKLVGIDFTHYRNNTGLKNIATKHLRGLASALTKYRADSKRIDVFAKVIGLSENDKFVSLACDFLLFVLRMVLRCEHDEDLGDGRVKHLLGDSVTKPHMINSELCKTTAQLSFQHL